MAKTWRDRLRDVIEERKTDMKAVSLGAGLNASAVFEMLKKGKDPTITTLAKVVEHLQLSYDELMSGAIPSASPRSVPVVGETAAGLWLEPDSWDEAKYPPVPFVPTRYADLEQRAFRVVGPSMNMAGIHDGSFVITVAYWDVRTQPQDGDIVIVERRRDGGLLERTVKEVVVLPDRIELTPRSTDERFKEPLAIPRTLHRSEETLEIEIVALVIGSYTPIKG
jgi:SOS-response transcriptional repressor LexA